MRAPLLRAPNPERTSPGALIWKERPGSGLFGDRPHTGSAVAREDGPRWSGPRQDAPTQGRSPLNIYGRNDS